MYNVCITHEYTRYTVLYNNPFYTVQGLFDMLPHQRKLSKEETMEVERLLSLKANKKMVKDKLEQMSGKLLL